MSKRIGVLGCGRWGSNHVRTLAGMGRLAAVADNNADKAAELAGRHGVPALDPDALIAEPTIDALVVALPARFHGPTARAAMWAGKHVLIEKPIALDVADAQETAQVVAETGRVFVVGHLLRHHPVFRTLTDAVREGRIGELRHMIAKRMGLGQFLPGMDAVWDLAPHDVSLILHLAGAEPVRIASEGRAILTDETDTADITLDFAGGLSAVIHASRVSAYRDRRFTAIGTEGMLVFDDGRPLGEKLAFYAHKVRRENGGYAFTSAEPEFLETPATPPLDAELAHFCACMEEGVSPETGIDEAVAAVRILAAASPIA